jgi:hypothetical protein
MMAGLTARRLGLALVNLKEDENEETKEGRQEMEET